MFQYSKYNVLDIRMPISGMNKSVSPDMLNDNFCQSLENIIPFPSGSGYVRFGTKTVENFENFESVIVNSFNFKKENGEEQVLFYVDSFKLDDTISEIVVHNNESFSFNCDLTERYKPDTRIKIIYTVEGVQFTLFSEISAVSVNANNVSIDISKDYFQPGIVTINQIWYSVGSIYLYNLTTNIGPTLLKDDLALNCIPRNEYFRRKLLIYNGINNIMSWDGVNLEEVYDLVKELYASNFIKISDTEFSFVMSPGFLDSKYYFHNLIRISLDGVFYDREISATAIAGNVMTVTVQGNHVPDFPEGASIEMFYRDYPPPFNFIYAAKNRLWALGHGPAGIKYRTQDQRLIVYYTYIPNTITGWFNENLKTVPSYDMSDNYRESDNFEAICQVNGFLAFIGREHAQIWSGQIPGRDGDFSWSSNLSVGIVSGELLIEFPNDVYFISSSGLKSVSSLNVAKQFAATADNAIDTIIKSQLSEITSSESNYRKCRSFKYDYGPIAGFKIGDNKILASLFSTKLYAWFLLSGDFMGASSFMQIGSSLYFCKNRKLINYSDGNDGKAKIYGDNNGKSLIPIYWAPKTLKIGDYGRLFNNKRYEIDLGYSSSFFKNKENIIDFSVTCESPNNLKISDRYSLSLRGDSISSAVLDDSYGQNINAMSLDFYYNEINRRFKFKSSKFTISVSGYVKNGPVVFNSIKLIGVSERS